MSPADEEPGLTSIDRIALEELLQAVQPLADFYREESEPLPEVVRLKDRDLPQPYRRLLAHRRDMTSSLERFFGARLTLRTLRREIHDDGLYRQVVLETATTAKPAEFGAIKIFLDHFAPPARELILAGEVPLGAILFQQGIEYRCKVAAFFRWARDPVTRAAFGLPEATGPERWHYGRKSVLTTAAGEKLAEAVEILPPLGDPGGGSRRHEARSGSLNE